jgi:hypothetical protein
MSAESVAISEHTLSGPDAGSLYTPHHPEQTFLHRMISEHLETFLAQSVDRGHPVPRFVEQEFRAFLRCGVLAHGFLRLHCDDCGHDRLVPFSCKRRGFCPACGGRCMADTAAHLVDRVLTQVPIRQWVFTLPYPLRYRCAYDARLSSEVLRAFVRALFAELRRRARRHWRARDPQCGAVTFLQRFGSALNLNLHFHTLALDGVYADADGPGTASRFLPLPPPDYELARVLAGAARRLQRLAAEHAGEDEGALARDEPLLGVLAAASLRGRSASGPNAGERWRRLGDRVEPVDGKDDPEVLPPTPQHGGMSLHAAVAVPARDRRRLERLCRYVARPPLANERLEELPDGRLAVRLKSRWRDGTTHILMQRSELIERLVPLIPPPRAHPVRYHGLLAPCASRRDRVVPAGDAALAGAGRKPDAETDGTSDHFSSADPGSAQTGLGQDALGFETSGTRAEPRTPAPSGADPRPPSNVDPRDFPPDRATRHRWAELLQRVFGIDALRCPHSGSTLRLIAAIEDPAVARKILECLKLPARAPPLAAALAIDRAPEPASPDLEAGWDFDQSPAFHEKARPVKSPTSLSPEGRLGDPVLLSRLPPRFHPHSL